MFICRRKPTKCGLYIKLQKALMLQKHPFPSSENRLIKYFVHSRQNMPGLLTDNTILIFEAPGIESEY